MTLFVGHTISEQFVLVYLAIFMLKTGSINVDETSLIMRHHKEVKEALCQPYIKIICIDTHITNRYIFHSLISKLPKHYFNTIQQRGNHVRNSVLKSDTHMHIEIMCVKQHTLTLSWYIRSYAKQLSINSDSIYFPAGQGSLFTKTDTALKLSADIQSLYVHCIW